MFPSAHITSGTAEWVLTSKVWLLNRCTNYVLYKLCLDLPLIERNAVLSSNLYCIFPGGGPHIQLRPAYLKKKSLKSLCLLRCSGFKETHSPEFVAQGIVGNAASFTPVLLLYRWAGDQTVCLKPNTFQVCFGTIYFRTHLIEMNSTMCLLRDFLSVCLPAQPWMCLLDCLPECGWI